MQAAEEWRCGAVWLHLVIRELAAPHVKVQGALPSVHSPLPSVLCLLWVWYHEPIDDDDQSTELTRGPPELVQHFRL
jgi:hypothetical protein